MSDDDFNLSRRSALAALASIGVGSAAVGAGTFAAFSDSEQTDGTDDSLETGSLDLQFNTNKKGRFELTTNKLRPGDTGKESVTLKNAGSLNGTLSVTLDSITNTDVSTPDSEPTGGQLSDALQMRMWVEPLDGNDGNTSLDGDGDEIQLLADGSTKAADTGKVDLKTADKFYDTDASSPASPVWDSSDSPSMPTLASAENYNLMFDWKLPENADNLNDISDIDAVQADKSTFNFTFTLTGT
jgi:predicted ribosomally synthesized peptide with SipW-like signal peptide